MRMRIGGSLLFVAAAAVVLATGAVESPEPVRVTVGDAEMKVDLGGGAMMELARIQPGEFAMGSPARETGRDSDEFPHKVAITKPYYLGRCEVTQKIWTRVMGTNPSIFRGENLPVEGISYDDCARFIARLNQMTPGGGFRLPTEAEWEFACRAGTQTRFFFGDAEGELGDYAWYRANSAGRTHPVGIRKPNPWGLFDMEGNVFEWCSDWYGPYLRVPSMDRDPRGVTESDARARRGGSWDSDSKMCRCAQRSFLVPTAQEAGGGMRLARTAD